MPQYRRRLFWTNIGPEYYDLFGFRHCDIPQPFDKKISLQSILTDGYTPRFKANCLKLKDSGGISLDLRRDKILVQKRFYDSGFENIIFNSPEFKIEKGIRFLNQIELERLHNIPEGYTKNLNCSKAHNLIGDGWTVDIIVHIFQYLK